MNDQQPAPSARLQLLAQVREAYGRVVYTHKTHEKQADKYFSSHRRQQQILVGLTVLSSGVFLASLLRLVLDETWAAVATSFVALLVSAINLGTKTFRYGEDAQKHRDVAAKAWNLRESYLSLIVDIQSGVLDLADARDRRDHLQHQAYEIYSDAPRTSSTAYQAAQAGLKDNEELTFTSQEIDHLLPESLRLGNEP